MVVGIAVVLAFFAILAGRAGYKNLSRLMGLIAFLTFVGWLWTGPGEMALEWINNPTGPDIPSVDINK